MPSTNTGKKRGKRTDLADWLARVHPRLIGDAEFAEISRALAPVSGSYLRKLLRESGVPLAPTVEGVRQASLDELQRSLIALLAEYESGDATKRMTIRRLVIAAKDRACWHGREKQEMELWMVTWLENPPVCPQWVNLRRATLNTLAPS
jgi:hypothetical protein